MTKFLIRLSATGVTIFGISYFFPSLVHVADFKSALLAALILAAVNALVRPIVIFITIPLTILTIGLFTLVVNAMMIVLVSYLMGDSFTIMGWWQAMIAAFLISAVSTFFSSR